MQRVVSNPGGDRISAQPPESTRWALAVAAFGQKLRGDPWLGGGFDWDAVLEQAGRPRRGSVRRAGGVRADGAGGGGVAGEGGCKV